MNESSLVTKVWNFAEVLRQSGMAYTDYVSQLTYMIFLKMDYQKFEEGYEESIIPDEYRWDKLKEKEGEELEKHYAGTLENLSRQKGILGVIFSKAQNKIDTPVHIKKMVTLIDGIDWVSLSIDVKGSIYEGLLERNATESKAGAGQYFTPRPLIKAIVEVMRPDIDMNIMDPACGTGGFLLEAYDYIKKHIGKDKDKNKKLKEDTLFGIDITHIVVSLCAMNLYLHGLGGADGNTTVKQGDSLAKKTDTVYKMVLTNPPFGKKSAFKIFNDDGEISTEKEDYYRDDFTVTTSNKQINFLQHIMSILAINGKAAVVLPDNVLFEGGAGEKVRRKLLNNCNLHTILRLPTGIFYAQGVKANVLFFDKVIPIENTAATKDIWIYDFRTNINFTLVTNPLTFKDLEDFIKCYNADDISKRKENERFKKFSYDEIIKRDKVNLDIFWIKDETLEDLDNLPEPYELLKSIKENFKETMDIIDSIDI